MRPYNAYRNSELSQQVSSVENTLPGKTSNSNSPFDILRSLSESISVDCGSFEISELSEYTNESHAGATSCGRPTSCELRGEDRKNREVKNEKRNPERRIPNTELKKSVVFPVTGTPDIDDDEYDCMNDPNYRVQCQNEVKSPSFEELMARTAEGIAKMREETAAAISNSEARKEKLEAPRKNANKINSPQPEARTVDSAEASKKSFLSKFSWEKTRKALFSKETIKLVFLSAALSALIVSAVIYKNSSRQNNGLPETEDVVVNQNATPVTNSALQDNNPSSNLQSVSNIPSPNLGYGDSSDMPNPRALTDQMRDDYQSPTFDQNPLEYQYSQNGSNGFSGSEDAGRQLISPHSVSYGNQVVESMPVYPAEPQYAEVSPAFGSQYNPNDYESPVLEDDGVNGYSETGYNSNFMR